jgi:paraquat-inducible protein A
MTDVTILPGADRVEAREPLAAPPLRATEDLVACPQCDALYRAREPEPGHRFACARCHATITTPRRHAGMAVISLALATVILVMGALWFPFLRIDAQGFSRSASLWDVAMSFAGGPLFAVSVGVTALIVVFPLIRAALTLYVLTPVVFDRPPRRGANRAFALSESLRPWSMGEIFAIGCAVSLVKVADLAHLTFGPAFWMFGALVVVTVAQDRIIDRWSVWRSLDPSRQAA